MLRLRRGISGRFQTRRNQQSARALRPAPEHLEARALLSTLEGARWTYTNPITFSFMPDGTSVGGVPSSLFSTMSAKSIPTAAWQSQIEQAASIWETNAGLNLALVSDNGADFGSGDYQQGDPSFGDIRIGSIPLPTGILAETYLPPPINGGSTAGDIMFNSNISWGINTYGSYDIMTVAAHEFGHALGLGDSSVSWAVMYGTYNGTNQSLSSDDISGIQQIYGAHQYDQFNINGNRNSTFFRPTNINGYLNNNQIVLSGLENTYAADMEYYKVTVPASTTGQMAVTVQSANFSSFAPGIMIYNSSLQLVSSVGAPNTYGATITSTNSVQAGQSYYIKVSTASGGGQVGTVGGYGLVVNFGSTPSPVFTPTYPTVSQQPNQASSSNIGLDQTGNSGAGGWLGGIGSGIGWPGGLPGGGNGWFGGGNGLFGGQSGGWNGVAWCQIGSVSGLAGLMMAPGWDQGLPSGPGTGSVTLVSVGQPPVQAGGPIGALPNFAPPMMVVSGPSGPPALFGGGTNLAPSTDPGLIFQALDAVLQEWNTRDKWLF